MNDNTMYISNARRTTNTLKSACVSLDEPMLGWSPEAKKK